MASAAVTLNIAEVVPEMIIVGIPNTDRNRDLTPDYILQDLEGEAKGEGDKFLQFIIKEAIPSIEQSLPTNGHRMLAGHSRAGLFTFDAFLKAPNAFDGYFCISPAFWRDNTIIKDKALDYFQGSEDRKGFLFLSLGEEENEKMKRGYEAITSLLDDINYENLRVEHRYIPLANHGNNLIYSTPIALKKWSVYYSEQRKRVEQE